MEDSYDSEQYIEIGLKFVRATVASDAHTVTGWIREISADYQPHKQDILVGLDTSVASLDGSAATLHLCVGYKCLIVQLCYIDYLPKSLMKLLRNMRYVFCGLEVEDTVAGLNEDYGLVIRRHRDIGEVAEEEQRMLRLSRRPGSWRPGMKELASVVSGLKIKKPIKTVAGSDWEAKTLTYQQIENACVNAHVCWKIAKKLDKMGN